jgi:hypothetical protein
LKDHLRSSDEWIGVLREISDDILAFEMLRGVLAEIVPNQFASYQVGRIYDMVLGPGTSPAPIHVSGPSVTIGPYVKSPATCEDHDPRTSQVAGLVVHLIESRLPGIVVEHVGSTAVLGCAGKGVVDLMVLYLPGRLPEVKDVLKALGFQQQTG